MNILYPERFIVTHTEHIMAGLTEAQTSLCMCGAMIDANSNLILHMRIGENGTKRKMPRLVNTKLSLLEKFDVTGAKRNPHLQESCGHD